MAHGDISFLAITVLSDIFITLLSPQVEKQGKAMRKAVCLVNQCSFYICFLLFLDSSGAVKCCVPVSRGVCQAVRGCSHRALLFGCRLRVDLLCSSLACPSGGGDAVCLTTVHAFVSSLVRIPDSVIPSV